MTVILSIFLLSIVASFIQRTTGFGFGIFIMTMLPFRPTGYFPWADIVIFSVTDL